MTIDIFDKAKEKTVPTWAKFAEAGDQYQGTYIGKIVGQIDGYGNEQVIYQLLQDDDNVINVGFGLNKKVMNQDMLAVKFGQIIGFRYKGKISVKDKFGKQVDVKDFALHQDTKIVNDTWLKDNEGNLPNVIDVSREQNKDASGANMNQFVESVKEESTSEEEDIPFSSGSSLTNEDKLIAIEKLSKEKLGAKNKQEIKDKVMEETSIAFIPVNYDKILEALTAL